MSDIADIVFNVGAHLCLGKGSGGPIQEWDLWTRKRTFATWKHFLQLWPPMASRSTWTNVFLPFQLWNFLATTFRRRDQLQRLIMPRHQNMPPPSGHQAIAPFNRSPEGGAKNIGVDRQGRRSFPNAKCLLTAVVPLQHPSPNPELSFLSLLTPPIPILAASCSKSQGTIGDLLFFFLAN